MVTWVSRPIAITATTMVLASAVEHHAAARAGALDRQRAAVEKPFGIVGGEPFAAAEALAGRADIADGAPRDLGQRLQQRVVGGADRIGRR